MFARKKATPFAPIPVHTGLTRYRLFYASIEVLLVVLGVMAEFCLYGQELHVRWATASPGSTAGDLEGKSIGVDAFRE